MRAVETTIPNNKDGFTLIEVMISMALMAMVFTAAFGTYFLGMRMVEDAREQLRASQIIQSELEAMRTLTWDDMVAMDGLYQLTPQGTFVQQFADDYSIWRSVYSINSTQKRVVVWVRWKNSRDEFVWQIFNTVFTKNGLNDYYYTTPA